MVEKSHRILVVDDLPDWRSTLSGLLTDEGHSVSVADSSDSALDVLGREKFDLAVLDMRLDETEEGNVEGLTLAGEIKKRWPGIKVIIITGYETTETVRQALEPDAEGRRLAEDYLEKTKTEELPEAIRRVLAL